MVTPRQHAEIPFAEHLEPFEGPLRSGSVYDTVSFEQLAFEDADGAACRFLESTFTGVNFERGSLRGARFNDVWCHSTRWVSTGLTNLDCVDWEVIASAVIGVEAYSSRLRRVRFFGCKFDSVNFRSAELTDVVFQDCQLRDVDFGQAKLTQVSFPGSTLSPVRFGQAQLKDVDLTGAKSLEPADGIEALRGATITHGQLLELAPLFAEAAGVVVR
jgi:uncharacterized protein YjbI with pentapeptide repeats